jgi:nitrous-oxide reductase
MKSKLPLVIGGVLIAGMAVGVALAPKQSTALASHADAASRTYVAPGEYDEFYTFMSGGYSGQVSVWGLPSARLMKVIPVFSQDPETGYGYSLETKNLLNTSYGFQAWDDSHHPHLSQTNGDADGRWLFINANNTPRIARLDLTTLETKEIIEIPNTGGNHGSSFVTQNTEYVIGATRFSIPTEKDQDVAIDSYKENFSGKISFVKVDPQDGTMALDFQLQVPPYNYDLARAGKGPSGDWVFFTTYNTEQAHTMLEINASQADKDFILAINWKKVAEAARNGKGRRVAAAYYHNYYDAGSGASVSNQHNDVLLINPSEVPGAVFFLPTPKSPHGVDIDPSGELIVAGGKLATVLPVHSFSNMQRAIENREFAEIINDIPVLKYESTIKAEVENPGLGPLHTEFDGKGYAYTSVYISSEVIKWSLTTFEVVDRIEAFYSIGHLMIPRGDNVNPAGRYLIGMTKTARDRFLPTGPKQNHPAQLYDISGDRMVLLKDFPTIGEPHYAQAIEASKLMPNMKKIYSLENNNHPHAIKRTQDARVERHGNLVRVYMAHIRSHQNPDNIEGIMVGDTVIFHHTNVEQDWDVVHGFAIKGMNTAEVLLAPGQTKSQMWVPTRAGVYPFYCTAFCSALHQEMQGYVRVSPRGANRPLAWRLGDQEFGAMARTAEE